MGGWSRWICGVIALLAPALGGCRPERAPAPAVVPAEEQATAAPGLDSPVSRLPARQGQPPEQVAQAYYAWYIANMVARFEGLSEVDGVLQAEGYLTDDLVSRIQAERAAGLMADPILCAQDVPRSVRVIEIAEEGREAQVLLGTSFEGHRLKVHLVQGEEGWQIARVNCRPEGEPSVAAAATPLPLAEAGPGWVQYHNPEYGLALLIPEDWTLQVLVQDPHQPPIGPPALRLAVYLAPREPASLANTPFAIEFAIGDEAELRGLYPEPTQEEPWEIGGLPAWREVEELGNGLALIRYVVMHPRFPERRVTLLDPISGFPERKAQAEEALAQFDRVLASLRFVD